MRLSVLLLATLASCSSDPPAVAPADSGTGAGDVLGVDVATDTNEGPDACWLAEMRGTPRPCTCADGRAGNLQGCDPPGCFCTGDAAVDARADTAPDVAVADESIDAAGDTSSPDDGGSDVAVADAGSADATPDIFRVDLGPADSGGPLDTRVSMLAISARSGTRMWTTANAQSCSVASGEMTFGADFCESPGFACVSFTGTLPMVGAQILGFVDEGGAGSTDLHATTTRGVSYTAGGTTRINARVSGTVVSGGSPRGIEVTILGCVVR